jgi:glycosyltransferase involved in cell wall biosynthesis
MNSTENTLTENKIRVAVVITGLGLGGMETRQLTVAKYINRQRFHLDFYCLYDEDNSLIPEFEKLGFNVYIVKVFDDTRSFPWRINIFAVLKLACMLRRGRYDIVHTQLPYANTVGRAAATLAGVSSRIATICNIEERSPLQQFWDKLLGRMSRKIMCLTDSILEYDISFTKLPRSKYVRIYNGIDIDRFSRKSAGVPEIDMGIPENAFVIGSVGRLHEQKDFKTLLRAFKILKEKITDAFLVIVGDGPEYADLKQLSEALEISGSMKFLGARKDVPEIISSFDIFVLSSVYEGFGNVIAEAMSMEIPVVSTSLPPVREIITAEENGILVPPGKPDIIAREIERLYYDKDLRKKLASAGRKTVENRFSQHIMVKNIEALYEDASKK